MTKAVWLFGFGLLIVLLAARSQAAFSGTMVVTAQNAHTYGTGAFAVRHRQEGGLTFFHVDVHTSQKNVTFHGCLVRVSHATTEVGNVFWVSSKYPVGGTDPSRRSASSAPPFRKVKVVRVNTIVPHPIKSGVSFDFAVPTQSLEPTGFVIDVTCDMPSAEEYWVDLKSWRPAK